MCDARNLHYITCIYMIHLIKYINVQNCIYIPVYNFSNRRDSVMRFSTLIYKKPRYREIFRSCEDFFREKTCVRELRGHRVSEVVELCNT